MYISPEILDQLMQTAISHYVTNKKMLKTRLKLYILCNLHINKPEETYFKYLYPICHAVEYLEYFGFDKYDPYIFREAWRTVWRIAYTENNNWHIEREKLIELHNYDREDIHLIMLDVAYEIIRHLPYVPLIIKDEDKKRIKEIDKLYDAVKAYRSSDNFTELINFIKDFPELAPYNAMLVNMQKPGSSMVATPEVWLKKYNRTPKTSARPLVILKRFGPVDFVYELSDTEGDPLPESIEKPFKAFGNVRNIIGYLITTLRKEGIDYLEVPYGTDFAGFIRDVRHLNKSSFPYYPKTDRGKTRYVPHEYDMVINSNLSDTEKCVTIFHELGHYFAGHFIYDKKNPNTPDRGPEIRNIQVREFEAETICWLVCERCNIYNPSEQYLHGYLSNNDEIPEGISIYHILKAAGKIESMLEFSYPLREKK